MNDLEIPLDKRREKFFVRREFTPCIWLQSLMKIDGMVNSHVLSSTKIKWFLAISLEMHQIGQTDPRTWSDAKKFPATQVTSKAYWVRISFLSLSPYRRPKLTANAILLASTLILKISTELRIRLLLRPRHSVDLVSYLKYFSNS